MSLFNIESRLTVTKDDGAGKRVPLGDDASILVGFGNEAVICHKVQDRLGITENLRTSKVIAEAAGAIVAANGFVDINDQKYKDLNAHGRKMADRFNDINRESELILDQFIADFRALLNEGDEYQDAYKTAYEKAEKALKLVIQRINIRYPKQFIDYFQKASIAKFKAENPGTV